MDATELAHRFAYHPPVSDATKALHEEIRDSVGNLALLLDVRLPDGREKSTVMTKLEEAMFWANAAVARTQWPPVED